MSQEAESELCQKILIVDEFPGTHFIGNISIITNATKMKKYFFGSTLKKESISICCYRQCLNLIFGSFNTKVSSGSFYLKNGNMIRLSTWKTGCFYLVKLYIFEKSSLRAFK